MADPSVQKSETPQDIETDAQGVVGRWLTEIELAESDCKTWRSRSAKTIKRYLDERSPDGTTGALDVGGFNTLGQVHFNILWANVQVLQPALYSRPPRPEVDRRYHDADPIGRVASIILERALEFSNEDDKLDATARLCVLDYLLTARAQVWVRYEPKFAPLAPAMPAEAGATEAPISQAPVPEAATQAQETLTSRTDTSATEGGGAEQIAWERAPLDRVHWNDFLHSPARGWHEVRWVARRTYQSRNELVKRFGKKIGSEVSLDWQPKYMEDKYTQGENAQKFQMFKKAVIWEIWDKDERKVHWVSPGYKSGVLDTRDDPLKLKDFFPCPEPLLGTRGPDTIIPVPDYYEYQDQAQLLDDLINRASLLTDALRVAGVYDASQPSITRLLTEGGGNVLIPVDNWALMAQSGGLKGTIDWMPIDQVAKCLLSIYEAIDRTKQQLYEITGISDIIRGQAEGGAKTATEQQIKSRYANLRLSDRQADVQRFLRDGIRLKAEVMSEHFQPQTLALMSGIELTTPEDQQLMGQAIALLRSDVMREFRIDIETDSTIAADQQAEQESRTQFLGMVGTFLKEALPVAQAAPPLVPLIVEMMNFGARGFKAGRQLEGALDRAGKQLTEQAQKAASQPPPPDPKMIEAQTKAEGAKQEMAMRAQETQAKAAEGQQKMQMDAAQGQQQLELDAQKHAMEMQQQREQFQQQMALERERMLKEFQLSIQKMAMEMQGKQVEREQDVQLQREGAAIDAAQRDEDRAAAAQAGEADRALSAEQADADRSTNEKIAMAAAKAKSKGPTK